MIAIHQLTRFLAGLGEIVNILTAPVVAALAYLAAMERFMGEHFMDEKYMGRHMDDQMMNDQMMTQFANHQDMAIFTSIIIAVVAVGFINGGFAVLFSMRRLLADGQGQASMKKTSMKTASVKPAAKSEAAKEAAKDMPQDSAKTAAAPSKPKAKVKAKKASSKAKVKKNSR